jgi:hypothetical protein
MSHALSWVAGWPCLAIGLLFVLRGLRLLHQERRLQRRPPPGEPFSGSEIVVQGVAFAMIGTANLLGGQWLLLAIPAAVIMFWLGVRLIAGWIRRWRRSP